MLQAFGCPTRCTARQPGQGQPGRDPGVAAPLGPCFWRVLYRGVAGAMVMLAVSPEAAQDRRGLDRAVWRAEERLKETGG